MTHPISDDKDLTELQRDADRQKSEWPEAKEAEYADETRDALPPATGSDTTVRE